MYNFKSLGSAASSSGVIPSDSNFQKRPKSKGFGGNVITSCVEPLYYSFCKPLPKQPILDLSRLKGLANNNFKFDENGRKLPKWEENTVGKGEIAHCEQFLLFPQCFQKYCTADA